MLKVLILFKSKHSLYQFCNVTAETYCIFVNKVYKFLHLGSGGVSYVIVKFV